MHERVYFGEGSSLVCQGTREGQFNQSEQGLNQDFSIRENLLPLSDYKPSLNLVTGNLLSKFVSKKNGTLVKFSCMEQGGMAH